MPSDPSKLSGLMWHDMPNRGGRVTIVPAERNLGDVGLSSGWQGDNAGQTAHDQAGQDFVIVPIAKYANSTPLVAKCLAASSTAAARTRNRSGADESAALQACRPRYSQSNPDCDQERDG